MIISASQCESPVFLKPQYLRMSSKTCVERGKKIGSEFLSNVISSPTGKRTGSCLIYRLNNLEELGLVKKNVKLFLFVFLQNNQLRANCFFKNRNLSPNLGAFMELILFAHTVFKYISLWTGVRRYTDTALCVLSFDLC